METASTSTVTSAPYGHACVNCSKSKTRCISRAIGACERCHRLRKECIPSAVSRKRSKKKPPSSKRSQLEAKLDGLVSLLQSQNTQKGLEVRRDDGQTVSPSSSTQRFAAVETNIPGLSGHAIANNPVSLDTLDPFVVTPAPSSYSTPNTATSYVNDLSPTKAEFFLERFRTLHLKFFPFFYIPPEMTALQLQTERPFLWLNIRAVCSHSAEEQSTLGVRIREILAKQVLVESERSIDLLLGLICYLAWSMYFSRGKPYICAMANLAVSMVFDLRLDRRASEDYSGTNPAFQCFRPFSFPRALAITKVYTNEDRRALLACFLTTTTICSFMRFEIARWVPHLDEALKKLAEDQESPDDKVLVALVRIMRVAEDATRLAWRPDDPELPMPVILHIRALEVALEQVESQLSSELLQNEIILSHLHSTRVVIYELATFQATSAHVSHDFKRREYLYACLNATKAALDAFLLVNVAAYPGVSFSIMIQFSHSAQVLYRLSLLEDPGWDRALVRQTADIIGYLNRAAAKTQEVHDMGYFEFGSSLDNIFEKAAAGLRSATGIWCATLDQIGAVTSSAQPTAGVIAEDPIEPVLAEVLDDTWLTDLFVSWEG